MTLLLAASAAFLLTHFVASTPLRGVLVKALGEWPYRGLYSLVALATLAWMISAYNGAPREALWLGWRLLPAIVMPFVFVLVACGYWRNPMLVGADKLMRNDDPARGVIRITRHPLMWAVMLWATVHILARGELASLVFFGTFLLLAGIGTLTMDARKRSNPDWTRFAAVTSHLPFAAIAQGRNRIVWREIGWLRPAIGLALYNGFLVGHQWLFGVAPF
jgi:uncharacterized membrane protein